MRDQKGTLRRPWGLRRDQWVLFTLVLISVALLVDTLFHLSHSSTPFRLQHSSSHPVDLLLRIGIASLQLLCIVYLWRSFRHQARLRLSLADAVREREEEAARVNTILDSISDRISIQDTDYRVLYQNRAHREAMGDQSGRFCYQAYARRSEICPQCPLVGAFEIGEVQRVEKSSRALGRTSWVEIVASPLRGADGEVIAVVEVVRDTTERRQREEAVQRLTEQLKASNRELEAFGSALSHDLRQPLTKIYLSAQALDETYPAGSNPAGDFLVRSVLDGCEEMERLMEAMLNLSRVTRHELRREDIDLSFLAENLALELRAAEPDRSGEFLIAPGLVANGDPALVRVLLKNLFANAWKYTRSQPRARVEFAAVKENGVTVYRVRDNGAGFDMSEADRLFQPFERLHSPKEFPGTGIGLVTCRRVVQRHGGRIWAESRPGFGATFFFTLPEHPANGRA